MTPIECEAMLLRHEAAVKQLQYVDLPERIELLAHIVNPSEELLAASLQVAEEKGPSQLACSISRRRVKLPLPEQRTLADILAA